MPSSVIRSHSYDPEREELAITFTTGRRYVYYPSSARGYEDSAPPSARAATSTPISATAMNSPRVARLPTPKSWMNKGLCAFTKPRPATLRFYRDPLSRGLHIKE